MTTCTSGPAPYIPRNAPLSFKHDLANTPGGDIRALWLSLPLPPWSREKQRDREICAAPSAAFQKDGEGIGPDHLEFDIWRPQAHPKTFLPLGYYGAGTIPSRPQLRPRRQDEIEPLHCSRLQSRAETSARILPGNELNGSAIDLLKTLKDLLPPSLLDGSIDLLI
jgi:hypothetical protein